MTQPGAKKRSPGARIAGLLVLTAIAYLAVAGVAAVFGSDDPWSYGILGIGPAVAGYYADTLRRRTRG
jgi:hypothetical protein